MLRISNSFSILLTIAIVLSIQLTTNTITGQLLTTQYLDVKLPRPNGCPKPWYDGDDTIFLLGGCGSGVYRNILKFSIASETIQNVASLPGDSLLGTVQSDAYGNIFYIGGVPSSTDVYKYDPVTNTVTLVALLPVNVATSISIKYNESSNTVFILGGWGQALDLLAFDMDTLTTSTVSTNLPYSVAAGTSVRVENKAYIFDDLYPNDNRTAVELDLDTFEMTTVGNPTLPAFSRLPSSVYDGTYAWIIGGYRTAGAPVDGIIRFDPRTYENSFFPVSNFPVGGTNTYFEYGPAAVFVPSSNRIYFFGGESYNYTADRMLYHDEIFFIDLTPLVEPTPPSTDFLACNNRADGFYPHSTDCSLYIRCQNEELTIFSCPAPLLFDSEGLKCDFPDLVPCSAKS